MINHKLLLLSTTLSLLLCLAGCANVIVAPADGFVCFPKQGLCPDTPVPDSWKQRVGAELRELTGSSEFALPVMTTKLDRKKLLEGDTSAPTDVCDIKVRWIAINNLTVLEEGETTSRP